MLVDYEESKSAEAGEDGMRAAKQPNSSRQGAIAKSKLISNEEFWQEFLEKNLAFATEPFRGNNPIFIPRVTDAKSYEDKYDPYQLQLMQTKTRDFNTESSKQELQ